MSLFRCSYLGGAVDLTDERERHITEEQPDLLPIASCLSRPSPIPIRIRTSSRFAGARLFSRWYDELRGGKHIVVVVATDLAGRHWIVTAYIARRLVPGVVEWQKA